MNKIILLIGIFSCTFFAKAQVLFLNNYADENHFIERTEILNKRFSDSLHLDVSPYDAKQVVDFLEQNENRNYTLRDEIIAKKIISKNHEWTGSWAETENSKKPILKRIYKTPSNAIEASSTDKYFIAINPIVYYQQNKENNVALNEFLNTRGAEVKARIGSRLSFYSSITDNQERQPSYMSEWSYANKAIIGQTYIKTFKQTAPDNIPNGFEYLNAQGYFSVNAIKDMLNVTMGFDRLKIGVGYRSMFMGDEGANYMFMNLNTKFWKLNYNNYYLELRPQYQWLQADQIYPRKYATVHHLSANVTKWLNLGLFESIVFHRKDRFEFQYMNPIILYRAVEQTLGSPDNAMLGFDARINTGKNILLYSQFLLDEFRFNDLRNNTGHWANKFSYQLGLKYINAFTLKNFDIQLERNYVRPFMYSYHDSLQEYSHYNQPLAHPNGSNFIEHIAVLRYEPIKRLKLQMDIILRAQGIDTNASVNNGSNIFMMNTDRKTINGQNVLGYFTLNGFRQNTNFINCNASYELRHNLLIDAGFIYRKQSIDVLSITGNSTNIYLGLRLNANRRRYNL